jgi:protein-tyrosine kinase
VDIDKEIKMQIPFDHEKLKTLGLSTEGPFANSVNEELRAIKRTLMKEAFGSEVRVSKNRIMITSVGEGDGKTFCSLNLARSISFELDKQVLLVDTNVLSPSIHNLLTSSPRKGLIDYLVDESMEAHEVIIGTDINRLRILPMGQNHHFANELLNSERMLSLMKEFNRRYNDRLVIFDSPPLLGVNEAQTLSHHVDQIVIVIPDSTVKVSDLQKVRDGLPKNIPVHYVLNKTLGSPVSWKNHNVEGEISENDKVLTGSSVLD